MTKRMRLALALLAAAGLYLIDQSARAPLPAPAQASWPLAAGTVAAPGLRLAAQGHIPMPTDAAAAHASYLLAMPKGHPAALTAFWFAGDRESAPNVQIAAAQWDRKTQAWTAARYVVNRHAMGLELGYGLRRLGNPVAWLDGDGRMHLFVVATGWGGWAASRVLHLRQSSFGSALDELAFEPARMLPLGWLWNTSFLVRNAPLPLADGGMVLPVYFELGIKYPVALRFDVDGNFVGTQRISAKTHSLQPTVVAQSAEHWLALMRDTRPNGKVLATQTRDGGKTWSDAPDLPLVNPDAAVAALALAPQDLLLVHNSSPASREKLDVSYSADGSDWKLLAQLENGQAGDEYSYPSLTWADGALWVSYTDHRRSIKWQQLVPATPVKEQP